MADNVPFRPTRVRAIAGTTSQVAVLAWIRPLVEALKVKLIVHVLTVPDSLLFLRGQPKFMAERGYRMAVITSPGEELERFAEDAGIPWRAVTMNRAISPVSDVKSLSLLIGNLRELRPAIVHAHTPKGGLLGMLAAAVLRVPKRVYHLRGLVMETANGRRRQLLRAAERVSCALATDIICVSHSLRQRVLAEGLAPPAKLRVMAKGSGQGVNSEHFAPPCKSDRESARSLWQLEPQDVAFVFVGRLVGDKGVVEMTEAFERTCRDAPRSRLVLVGKVEARDAVDHDVLARLRLNPAVTFAGFMPDTRPAYAAADVVLLPSRREGFPNVPLEAAAMSVPVITTDATGCIDSVVDDVTGRIVPVRDAVALSEAMLDYARDAESRRRHGDAGRERVVRDFQPRAIWEDIARVYAG